MPTAATHIAGEPAVYLAQSLSQVDIVRAEDGTMSINARLEGEIGASLLRAVERYGAEVVTAERLRDVENRQAEAFIRIVEELAALAGAPGPGQQTHRN